MRAPTKAALAALALAGTSTCASNPCVDMCQQMQGWLDRCGATWEGQWPEAGWISINDCYDTYWEAGESIRDECEQTAEDYSARDDCY